MKIMLKNMNNVSCPIYTPAGVVEKHFEATVTNLDASDIFIVLEIEFRTEDKKNPNKILLKKIEIIDPNLSGKGITAVTLRNYKLKEIQNKCISAAIDKWYPQTKFNKKTFELPSPNKVKRIDLVASIMQKHGGKIASKTIQKELQKLKISMNVRSINNYRSKINKANRFFNYSIVDSLEFKERK